MRDAFHKELEVLHQHVIEMADLARWMLVEGVASIATLDRARAQAVIDKKGLLAQMDDDIESEALHLVARQQPMARDMRAVAAALKLITYINRLGRYGKDIAQIAHDWKGDPHATRPVQVLHMAETTAKMLDMVMTAYRTQQVFDTVQLVEWEAIMDSTRWTVFRECITYMQQDPRNIEPCAHFTMIARYLERCADNVCKMGEKTHYMVTGERIVIK